MYAIIPQQIPQDRRAEVNEKILFAIDSGKDLVLGNLLGYDGIHVFSFLMVGNEDTPQGCLTGCLNKYFMNQSSLSVISSSRSFL